MASVSDRIVLGRTGLAVSRLGLASNGIDRAGVERAVDLGVNYLYWGTVRHASFGEGVRHVSKTRREDLVIVVQSYTRIACLMRPSINRALRRLGIEYADLLLLGMWNEPPGPGVLDAARALVAEGKAKHVMISCHRRPTFQHYIDDPTYGAIMVRYNAAHPGAEREVFPHLAPRGVTSGGGAPHRPGVVTYTATRWGALLDPGLTPPGEITPRASDCYRFALNNPDVDVTLTGPKDDAELTEAFAAIERGPMSGDEIAWMKRVGVGVRANAKGAKSGNVLVSLLDRLTGARDPDKGS